MNNIYDNGYKVLGKVIDIKEYINKNCKENEDLKEVLFDLEELDNNTIVMINYDNPMGYNIDYWDIKDIVKDNEV